MMNLPFLRFLLILVSGRPFGLSSRGRLPILRLGRRGNLRGFKSLSLSSRIKDRRIPEPITTFREETRASSLTRRE
jgi:hypothetical protein